MSWLMQSLDLNTIENVWQILKIKFQQCFTHLCCTLLKSQESIEKYDGILQEVWWELNLTMISNLIKFMLGHMNAVIEAKGNVIHY